MPTELAFDRLHRMASGESKETPFDGADEAARVCARSEVRLFGRAKARLAGTSDLYAMLDIVYGCYQEAWTAYDTCLKKAYAAAYLLAMPGAQRDGLTAAASYEDGYALTGGFIPRNEWERKRARAYESYVAGRRAGGIAAGNAAWDRARNLAGRQSVQGADDMTIIALHDAFEAAGVQRVRYCAVEDGRTCTTCLPRNGRTYRLGSEPHLPAHPNCRCWYEPVRQ